MASALCSLELARSGARSKLGRFRQSGRRVVRCCSSNANDSAEVGVSEQQLMEELAKMEPAVTKRRSELLHEALQTLATQDLETSMQKYNLEEELFAEIDFVRVNAFTFSAFGGNPAAVVYLPKMTSDAWHLAIAQEFNISETAYVVRRRGRSSTAAGEASAVKSKGFGAKSELIERDSATGAVKPSKKIAATKPSNEFDLRWFTPAAEVDLCGHATLASAHFLFSTGIVAPDDRITFHTRSGALASSRIALEDSVFAHLFGNASKGEKKEQKNDGSKPMAAEKRPKGAGIYDLDFPFDDFVAEISKEELEGVKEAFPGADIVWAGKTALKNWIIELASEEQVKALEPVMDKVAALEGFGVGVTSAAAAGKTYDYVARYFAPNFGINEDPATGSLQCSLAPYWSEKLGKDILLGNQISARGGLFGLKVNRETKRVNIQGSAVLVMAGSLMNTASSN